MRHRCWSGVPQLKEVGHWLAPLRLVRTVSQPPAVPCPRLVQQEVEWPSWQEAAAPVEREGVSSTLRGERECLQQPLLYVRAFPRPSAIIIVGQPQARIPLRRSRLVGRLRPRKAIG